MTESSAPCGTVMMLERMMVLTGTAAAAPTDTRMMPMTESLYTKGENSRGSVTLVETRKMTLRRGGGVVDGADVGVAVTELAVLHTPVM